MVKICCAIRCRNGWRVFNCVILSLSTAVQICICISIVVKICVCRKNMIKCICSSQIKNDKVYMLCVCVCVCFLYVIHIFTTWIRYTLSWIKYTLSWIKWLEHIHFIMLNIYMIKCICSSVYVYSTYTKCICSSQLCWLCVRW